MEKLKYLDEIAEERGITRHMLDLWHRRGMKTVRLDKLKTTDKWEDEWINKLAEQRENEAKYHFEVIEKPKVKNKPLKVIGINRVY